MATEQWLSDEQHTIPQLLDQRLSDDPDSEFLDVCGTKFSTREVATEAWRLASALGDLGIRHGDRIASLIENSPEAMLFWWGVVTGGAIAVPINTAYKGDYLRHQLTDSGSRVVFVQGDLASRLAAVLPDTPTIEHVVVIGEPDAELAGIGPTIHVWADLLGASADEPSVEISPSDLGTFIYTGGTTGPSKGCMLSHNYHEVLSRQIGMCWRRTSTDVVWTPLPLFHFNALVTAVLGSLVYGGRGAIYKRFSVSNFWPEMNRTGATITSTLGTMAYLLADDQDRPEMPGSGSAEANTSLRMIAAAPLPPAVDSKLRDRFGISTFSGAFGLTEASLVAWQPSGVENKPGAAGVINDEFFDLRIFDDHDNEVQTNEPGEIVVRPKRPHVMFEGYWGDDAATVRANRNLWFHTGDLGRVDEDDFLFFVDRKADYIRRRGENISSFEVERILMQQGSLAEVVVHALPSEMTEDDLKVTATLVDEADLTEEQLFRWATDKLPYFALPRYIEFRDELPKSPVGRVLKRILRDDGVTDATWDAEAAGIEYERR